ncbi:MAG: cytochrome d ubiquinol oxidase subunit II [Bryobacteraceae bacterium]
METVWFALVAVLLAGYVVLDGFDIGAGIIHLFVAKTDAERRAVLASIGPVWDGNEVWLLAAGGTLYFAFPALYASSFSGFYLALMIVLWLLILRGISIELRNHIDNPLWHSLWDAGFAFSSILLAIFFGTALGNVVRGVPLDADGYFFLPLWTNFQPGSDAGIIDWYTVLIGVAALAALTMHGALWIQLKNTGEVQKRASRLAYYAWGATRPLSIAITIASFKVQPHLSANFEANPWGIVFPAVALGSFIAIRRLPEAPAFFSSCAFIVSALCSVAFGLYPNVLPSNLDPARSLTVTNAAAPAYGLAVGFYWFIPAMLLALGYSYFVYRHFWGKVDVPST